MACLTLTTYLPMPQYRLVAAREASDARVLQDVRALPGVTAAGFVSFLPMSSFRGGIWPVAREGGCRSSETTSGARPTSLASGSVTPGILPGNGDDARARTRDRRVRRPGAVSSQPL